ncbi:BrnT family toxin [Campylobacter helveticus]|uniref:BrnT family toxin n=1 Tax=Campylobacter helveticus TaxID=28898 RepID=UPI002149A519|nr:BrnT family toxin [Campylobacter helveticus]MCR2063215.1 BrnT family toxin [Campylobacter helveticus]
MKFEWDEEKNKTNQIKYGISFDVAREIFDDPFTLSFLDERFNYLEERWIKYRAEQK